MQQQCDLRKRPSENKKFRRPVMYIRALKSNGGRPNRVRSNAAAQMGALGHLSVSGGKRQTHWPNKRLQPADFARSHPPAAALQFACIMKHQLAGTLPKAGGRNKQSLELVAAQPHKADGRFCFIAQHPHFKAGQGLVAYHNQQPADILL